MPPPRPSGWGRLLASAPGCEGPAAPLCGPPPGQQEGRGRFGTVGEVNAPGARSRVAGGGGESAALAGGAGHLALSCDVSSEKEVQNTFEEIQRHLGPINYLVNAAGINRDGLLLRAKTEDMIAQIHTNLLGTMLTCKAAVKIMTRQQGGAIVNIGSIVGLKGNSGQSVYSATKAGLLGFSRSLAKEVAKKQIRVNVVAPGFIRTDMTAHLEEDQLKKSILLGRFGEPREVAQAVVFLLESPYVTGTTLIVDGGLQLMT